jgi:ribonuclease D
MRAGVELDKAAMRRHGNELLRLLASQRAVPDSELPQPLPRPLDAGQRTRLKKLKAAARELAGALSAAPEALLQSKDYELLLREANGENVKQPAHWQGWRLDKVISPLRARLAADR